MNRNDLVVIEESHRAKVLEQVETAQRQADVSKFHFLTALNVHRSAFSGGLKIAH